MDNSTVKAGDLAEEKEMLPKNGAKCSPDPRVERGNDTLASPGSRRQLITQTIFVLAIHFTLGLLRGQEGVAFLDLLLTTNSDIEAGSVLLAVSAFGYLAGCLFCGFLYDHFNNNIIFLMSSIMVGLLTLVIPWCSYLPLMVAIFGLRSFFAGPAESGSSIMCARMWLSRAGPILQSVHFVYAVGGIIAPIVTNPFLLDVRDSEWDNRTARCRHGNGDQAGSRFKYRMDSVSLNGSSSVTYQSSADNHTFRLSSIYTEITSIFQLNQNHTSAVPEHGDDLFESRTTEVYIAFIISGCTMLVIDSLFGSSVFRELLGGRSSTAYVKAHRQDKVKTKIKSRRTVVKMAGFLLLGINFFAYGCVEKIWMNYLMAYLVEMFGWSKTYGSIANAVFWGGFAGGRFVCIFVMKCVRPGLLLLIGYSGQTIAYIVLAFVCQLPEVLTWIVIGVAGLFMASVYATTLYWSDQNFVPLSGKVMTYIAVCQFTGTMTHMVLLGYLFEKFTPMWFVYLPLIHTVLGLLSFWALSLVTRTFKGYNSPGHHETDMEKSINSLNATS